MPHEDHDQEIIKRINTRSEELMGDVREHVKEVREAHPEATDESRIFEAWVIQKIAALQIMLENQATVLNALIDKKSGNGRA